MTECSHCLALQAEIARLQEENRLLKSGHHSATVRHLHDLWLAEEQECIDALRRAETAEAEVARLTQERHVDGSR
jgi:hypothetical protein